MRPRMLARMMRVQAALDSKAGSAAKIWTDAHATGYHDHVHLIPSFLRVCDRNVDRDSERYMFEYLRRPYARPPN